MTKFSRRKSDGYLTFLKISGVNCWNPNAILWRNFPKELQMSTKKSTRVRPYYSYSIGPPRSIQCPLKLSLRNSLTGAA